MACHVKLRKEKVGIVDYDTQIKEVRCQLVDQLKLFDLQLEQKSQQLQDLTDYLRRRGEIEGEYARSLDKLAERFTSKIKRKEPSGQSAAQIWLAVLSLTRQESKDHNGLSESCSNVLTQPLTHCLEYTQRLARKSKDICTQLQDGLLKVTTELQTAWRTYYQYHTDYVCAEGKLKEAEKLEEKQKQSAAKKVERLKEKRLIKVQEIHLKCSKARNDYLLNLSAANASMKKYYLKDISSLIDCADTGYHLSLGHVMQAYLSKRWRAQGNLGTGLQQLQGEVAGLNQSQDRDTFLQAHHNAFCLPLRFHYQPHDGDQVSEVCAESEMRCELETRFKQIQTRLTAVTKETEGAYECLQTAQSYLLESLSLSNDDLEAGGASDLSQEGSTENLAARLSGARRRINLQEAENLYITRFKEYLVDTSLVSKLQAKHDLLKLAIEKAEATNGQEARHIKSMRVKKSQSSSKLTYNLGLFTGNMMSFIQASGQQIPLVVESCIRFINLNGLHHEGIFRVPGSQAEVNNLRDAFEREIEDEAERAAQLKTVISSYPEPVIVVMRYLFAFLHHVAQYSDENMMQPYNLAVCFGPTLVRGAHDDDVVTLQPQINALVKSIILQHESIFPSQDEVQGPVYEKCMTLEQDDCEAIIEEGDGEAEASHSKNELDTVFLTDQSTSLPAAKIQKKGEHLRTNSRGSPDPSGPGGLPTAGSIIQGGKFMLQLAVGPQSKLPLAYSPGLRRESHHQSSSEDITIQVDKDVCRQMDSVFKELLSRQVLQDPSSATTSSSGQALQRKGKREERRWKATGLFRSADQVD
ncbi:rho GTPase-activating protein 4a isoform X2 [Lampris incognitus]|uniref:rho GTPase-activating protein 4a isoform X2 n=1 Tax=Lampris incognitus TaxID=2546036 RepID=UPI0024B59F8E|nr:rho GTPase-activating protein 4a isoform X2 [Lampris incognitus]